MSRRHLRMIPLVILAFTLLSSLGCRKTLKSPVPVSTEILGYRSQYEAENPGDPHLVDIRDERVCIGMNTAQVFLAWGRPRVRETEEDSKETWVYEFSEGLQEQPRKMAQLYFENKKLVDWDVSHGFLYIVDPGSDASLGTDMGISTPSK